MTYETKSQYGNMLAPIVADFKRIPENRMMGKVRFKLATVLTLVLIALAAGRRTWNSFQAYGEEYHEFLLDTVPFFTSVPSGDAISRIVGGLDPSYLHAIILKHGKTFSMFANSNRPGPRPANARYCHFILDGKTVKGAVIPGEDGSMFHIVNVVTDKRVFVASMGVESKSNEIPVYPILIRKLFDAGTIRPGDALSIDAMGAKGRSPRSTPDWASISS